MEKRKTAPTVAAVVALALILWWFAGPRPSFVSDPGEVSWSGGTCLNLEVKEVDAWSRIASASVADAIERNWDAPRDWAGCADDQVTGVSLIIPGSFEPGLYRICDAITDACFEARHAP